MKQIELFEKVSLPKKRSRIPESKAIFAKKELTDRQKEWLRSHDETNWQNIALSQNYTNPKGISKKLVWKLPGTELKNETCGLWKTVGCDNVFGHPDNKQFIKHSKISCFRSKCEYCWLEKWLSRESTRATQRIENYIDVFKHLQFARSPNLQRKYLRPIHVIVSPSWKDKFLSFDELKNKARKLINKAGIEGGLMIYHPFGFDKKKKEWIVRPHFHILGFGWIINTKKISDSDGWVIKNKGLRDSLHSTIYYQLSHAGVSDGVHAITWFGSLSYRAKYSSYFKVEDDDEHGFCDFCGCMLVEFEYVGNGDPPDFEFVGLVDVNYWKAKETLEEAVMKKEMLRNNIKNRYKNPRKDYINDGQSIGSDYSRFLERIECLQNCKIIFQS
ncbi:hypothetical protein BD31_I1306 [Candidatus Nitrosopumilus salaria BD31]|uniref:Replication protein n=1 Tax=Candidatus Nitrosopumilus salarius BD31 TaxID=859350 RepID=I3D2U7_9ARCH|nr:hypothetical protein [Candidatus Nitrosopumilus salaria]EIJ66040.1 hypothetical protein BD31_I1306 [Candidatus Nitrosopumilus salaria BD31]